MTLPFKKASIFIGSSSEALPVARSVAAELRKEFDVQIWDERLFQLGEDTLTGLLRAVQAFDFAVLIISDDDTVISQKQHSAALKPWWQKSFEKLCGARTKFASPRDNVIFELGMFIGAMGRRKAFAIVAPSDRGAPKLPSDLFGNTLVYLKPQTVAALRGVSVSPVAVAALSTEIEQLAGTMRERFENESEFELLPSTGSAVNYFHNFVLPLCQQIYKQNALELQGKTWDMKTTPFKFRILIPTSLQEANRPFAEQLFNKLPVTPFVIESSHRPFPFWVGTAFEGKNLVFWDYPTVLRASDEAVLYVTKGAYLSNPVIRKRFEEKELHNFERTLRLLMQTVAEASVFRDVIEIVPSSSV